MFANSDQIFCAFCKLPHRIYKSKDLGGMMVFFFLGLSLLFSFLIWKRPHFYSLSFFGFFVLSSQFFFRLRWRSSLRCPHCQFDPIVYRKNPEQAAENVKSFLDQRKGDPNFLLRSQPRITPRIERSEKWREALVPVEPKDSAPFESAGQNFE